MRYFLMVYDREVGKILEDREFDDRAAALRERFRLEQEQREHPSLEVVVLAAPSRETLERTHSRYFTSVDRSVEALVQSV